MAENEIFFELSLDQEVVSDMCPVVAEPSWRQHTGRLLGQPLLALVMLAGGTFASEIDYAGSAHADSSQEYSVYGTGNGVWSRNSPHENDTPRIDGYGAYDGDTVDLICGVTNGDPVGPYNNTTWHLVKDVSRPDENNFWLNDHWVKSPNVAGQLVPGESNCNSSSLAEPVPASPIASHYAGNCKENTGAEALQGWNNALGTMNADGELKTQLEQYDVLWGNSGQDDICVGAQLSDQDGVRHRQFLRSIVAQAPDIDPAGCDGSDLIEVWGDGFYKKTACTGPTQWIINKWLNGGTYVCAARSDAADTVGASKESDLVAAAKSGQAKLGSNDPYRGITCIAIKA